MKQTIHDMLKQLIGKLDERLQKFNEPVTLLRKEEGKETWRHPSLTGQKKSPLDTLRDLFSTEIADPRVQSNVVPPRIQEDYLPQEPSTSVPEEYFGLGQIPMELAPALFQAILEATQDPEQRAFLGALASQESRGGYDLENISDVEESYGPYQINMGARRTDPETGQVITKEQALDPLWASNYVLSELLKHGGDYEALLTTPGTGWNSLAPDYYKDTILGRQQRKQFYPGD